MRESTNPADDPRVTMAATTEAYWRLEAYNRREVGVLRKA